MKDYSLTGIQTASGLSTVALGQPAYFDALINSAVTNGDVVSVTWSLTNAPLGSVASITNSPLGTNVPPYRMVERTAMKVAGSLIPGMANLHSHAFQRAMAGLAEHQTAPVYYQGKVWTLGAEGNLFCLDATNGKVLWSHDFKADYGAKTPQWGFAGHPLLDGPRLICLAGGPGSVAVAFDKDSGNSTFIMATS